MKTSETLQPFTIAVKSIDKNQIHVFPMKTKTLSGRKGREKKEKNFERENEFSPKSRAIKIFSFSLQLKFSATRCVSIEIIKSFH